MKVNALPFDLHRQRLALRGVETILLPFVIHFDTLSTFQYGEGKYIYDIECTLSPPPTHNNYISLKSPTLDKIIDRKAT
jgi:hypothetical protein